MKFVSVHPTPMFPDEPATAPLETKPTETAAVTSKPETSEPDSPTETAAVTSKSETSEPDSPTETAAVTSKPETSEPDSPTEPEVPDKTKPTVGTQPKTEPTTEQVNSTSSECHTSYTQYSMYDLVWYPSNALGRRKVSIPLPKLPCGLTRLCIYCAPLLLVQDLCTITILA